MARSPDTGEISRHGTEPPDRASQPSRPGDRPGAEGRFRRLFDRHGPEVYRFFVRKGLTAEDARELTQDAFVRVYRGLEGFRGDAEARTWIFSIAHDLYRNALRHGSASKRRRNEGPAADASTVAATWERHRGTVWDEVQRRIGAGKGAPGAPAALPGGHPVIRFVATAALAAACLILSVLLWQAREEVERRHPVSFITLDPAGSGLLRGGSPPDRIVKRPPRGHKVVLLLTFPEADRYSRYAAEILPPPGEGPGEVVEIHPRSDETLGVELGIDPPPGQYHVLLHAVEGDETRHLASYGFRVGLPEESGRPDL